MIAVGLAATALALLLWLAPHVGWLDRPDARKPHAMPVPPVGGVAWFVGFAGALLACGVVNGSQAITILAAIAAMLVVGVVDDLRPQASWLRLIAQATIVAALAATGAMVLDSLGALVPGLKSVDLGPLAIAFSVFAGVGVVNATNMSDGMDGLAGTQIGLTLVAVLVLLSGSGLAFEQTLASAGLAALLPFLLLNMRLPWQRRARVFFGDAGSMAAGLLLAILLVRITQGPHAVMPPAAALWLLAVPLVDTVSVMLRRIDAGLSPFKPDQQHVHHILLRTGMGVSAAWLVLTLVAALAAATAIMMVEFAVPDYAQFASFMLLAVLYHRWVCRGLRRGRVFGRTLSEQLSQL